MSGLFGTTLTADEVLNSMRDLGRGINLGSTSGLFGGPVDLVTQAYNATAPNVFPTVFPKIEKPVMGSQWIEEKLVPIGLLPQRQGTWQEGVGELASGFINPMAAAATAGPALYRAETQMLNNAMSGRGHMPGSPANQAGYVNFYPNRAKAPQIGKGELPEHTGLGGRYPSGARHLADDANVIIQAGDNGLFSSTYTPAWGNKNKPFHAVGDNLDELLESTKKKITNAERGSKAAQSRSLEGRLSKEFGDGTFRVKKSERSASQYVTHEPSGLKFRISDHPLPAGYEQADFDLPLGTSPSDIVKFMRKQISGGSER